VSHTLVLLLPVVLFNLLAEDKNHVNVVIVKKFLTGQAAEEGLASTCVPLDQDSWLIGVELFPNVVETNVLKREELVVNQERTVDFKWFFTTGQKGVIPFLGFFVFKLKFVTVIPDQVIKKADLVTIPKSTVGI